jgi:tetratricopeptide (TPR) repeat protein
MAITPITWFRRLTARLAQTGARLLLDIAERLADEALPTQPSPPPRMVPDPNELRPTEPTVEDPLAEGDRCYQARLIPQALTAYRRAVAARPDHFLAFQKLGEALVLDGEPEAAREAFLEAARLHPTYFRSRHSLGELLVAQGRPEEALVEFDQGLRLYPEFALGHLARGETLCALERREEAVEAFSRAIALAPELLRAYPWLGRNLAILGRQDEAAEVHLQACERNGWDGCRAKAYRFVMEGWFATHILIWRQHLSSLTGRPGAMALEVGSFEGMSACWMLDHVLIHPSASLTTIDPAYQLGFDSNIQRTGSGDRVRKLTGKSEDVLPGLRGELFDFVYLDGLHLAPNVLLDALHCWDLTRVGGLMVFDDYLKPAQMGLGQPTKLGADLFLELFGGRLRVRHSAYQLWVEKTRPDIDACMGTNLSNALKALLRDAGEAESKTAAPLLTELRAPGRTLDRALPLVRDILALGVHLPWDETLLAAARG